MNSEHLELLTSGADKMERWRLQAWHDFRATPNGRRFVEMFPEYIETDPLPPPGHGLDLRGADLSSHAYQGLNLGGAKLDGANLTNTLLYDCLLTEAQLTGAKLGGARFHHSILRRVDLVDVMGADAAFGFTDISQSKCDGADFTGADFTGALLHQVSFRYATLTDSNLQYAICTNSDFSQASLDRASVYGISVWDCDLQDCSQCDLKVGWQEKSRGTGNPYIAIKRPFPRPHDGSPAINLALTVDRLDMAQFLYLILENANLRGVIDTFTSSVVLILGRFSVSRKSILEKIRVHLRRLGFVPVLFDFDRPTDRDLVETVTTLARLSRFVVADVTDATMVREELRSFAGDVAVPIQPLLLEGAEEYIGLKDLRRRYHWVLDIQRYSDEDDLQSHFEDLVVRGAEIKRGELRLPQT